MTSESAEGAVLTCWEVAFGWLQPCMAVAVLLAGLLDGWDFLTVIGSAGGVWLFAPIALPGIAVIGDADLVGAVCAVGTAFYCACIVNAIYFHFMAARLPIEEGLATMEQTQELEGRKKLAREKTKVRALCITLAVVCAFCLWWGWSKGDANDAALEARYETGYDEGYEKGTYDQGLKDKDIWTEKVTAARKEGYDQGYRVGSDALAASLEDRIQEAQSTRRSTSNSTQTTSQTVYVTATGSKYHRSGCSYLRQSCYSISLNDAKARGYTACSRCW